MCLLGNKRSEQKRKKIKNKKGVDTAKTIVIVGQSGIHSKLSNIL